MNTRKKKRQKNLTIILSIVVLIGILTTFVFVLKKVFFKGSQEGADSHQMIMDAIANTEAMEDFFVQVSSTSRITKESLSQKVVTNGYIYTLDKKDFVYVYANTASTTSGSTANDFDVTVSMYSDGKHVYDNSTGKNEIIDGITCEEFDGIVSEYELYKPQKEDVIKYTFNEDQNLKDGKSGDMIISLSNLNDKVIKSIQETISRYTNENVEAEKIRTASAIAIYSIYEGTVVSQSCSFSVSYENENGKLIKYSVETNITYLEETDEEDTSFVLLQSEEEK